MKILVADDDATSRLLLQMELQSLGHDCDTTTDGTEAWKAFQSGRPDVVISDWMMPGQSGPELCENIRAHADGANVFVILLTSCEASAQIEQGMSAGVDEYITKPYDPDELELLLLTAASRVTTPAATLGAPPVGTL
jgi:DNA-binding response OmpR family regulator